jgi:hypothetical protein
MSDNVTNYQAVASLPPFPLFPWFFVVPGVLVVGFVVVAGTRRDAAGRVVSGHLARSTTTEPPTAPAPTSASTLTVSEGVR